MHRHLALLGAISILLPGCGSGKKPDRTTDWLIVPGVRAGPVDSTTSERALIERVGADRVVRRDIHIGEGFCAPGSVVDAGTADSLIVIWTDSTFSRPAAVEVDG